MLQCPIAGDATDYVSCVLFEIVGVIWRLSLCLLSAHASCVFNVAGFGKIGD